jgi:hypothetical protein
MRRNSTYFFVLILALLMAITFADFGCTQAKQTQSAAASQAQMYRVTTVQVKSGMGLEWEAFLKDEVVPMMKKRGVSEFQTWTTAFGNAGEYDLLTPLKSLAELDSSGPLASAGQEERAAMMAKLQRLTDSAQLALIQSQNDLTIPAKSDYVPKIGTLVTNTVAIDRDEDFIKSSKTVMAAVQKTNAKGFLTSRLAAGGDLSKFYTLTLFDSFADLEKFTPGYIKALSEAKLAPQTGIVIQRDLKIVRYIPELSIRPVAP